MNQLFYNGNKICLSLIEKIDEPMVFSRNIYVAVNLIVLIDFLVVNNKAP